jgi:argininosuccinate lyase
MLENSLKIDSRLFRAEIRASAAHADALFRAGVLTRPEAERIKNGLWTILKRTDFDRNYFDNSNAANVFEFVEEKLFQLLDKSAQKLQTGRKSATKAAIALRIWLRDEIETILDSIENLRNILTAKNYGCFAAAFARDDERLREVLRRTNQFPAWTIDFQTNSAEFDFQTLARDLGFAEVIENADFNDRDFCVEFASAASLTILHLSNLENAALSEKTATQQQNPQVLRSKIGRIFGNQTALLVTLKNLPRDSHADLNETAVFVFEIADTLKFCLQTAIRDI